MPNTRQLEKYFKSDNQKGSNMKQTSNPWTKLFMLMLIAASAVVLFTVTALAKSPSSMLASEDSVHAPAVPTQPPSNIYIGTRYSGKIDEDDNLNGQEFRFQRNDILNCVPNTQGKCAWDLFFDGSADLSGVNVRDFEVLANGDIIFAIDRNKTLSGIDFTSRDVIRYSSGTYSLYWAGSAVCLTKSNEAIDAVAFAANGNLVISTWGTATFCNGLRVDDEDLVEIDGTTPSLYLDGTKFELTSSSEDISSAWIGGNQSPENNIYLAVKGSFHAVGVNTLSGKKSDIFGCSATSAAVPIDNCFFFKFFEGKPAGLNHQIDGISIVPDGPIVNAVVSAALKTVADSTVSDSEADAVDATTYAEAMSEGDSEITAEDFIDVSTRLYLPIIVGR